MLALTLTGVSTCDHGGVVALKASQSWVTINGAPWLVDNDPQGCSIAGCPNVGTTIKPCTSTLAVTDGYCSWIKIGGKKIAMDTVTGKTDGTPPSSVSYTIKNAGQAMVDVQ